MPASERIFVCPRGVDATQFTPEKSSDSVKREMRERAGIPETAITLLYAGRVSPEKNIGLLVEMIKILAKDESRDYRLLVAGAGPLANWLKEQAEEHFPGKIIQLGHLDNEQTAALAARLSGTRLTRLWLGHLSKHNNTPERAHEVVASRAKGIDVEVLPHGHVCALDVRRKRPAQLALPFA